MYDEDAVEQYQKMLAESLTSGDIEEDVNATGKALTAVICSAAMKCFGQRAPFGRRVYWWTDEYDTVQKECCALYETYRTTMTTESRTKFNKRRTEKNKLKRKLKHAFVQKQAQANTPSLQSAALVTADFPFTCNVPRGFIMHSLCRSTYDTCSYIGRY